MRKLGDVLGPAVGRDAIVRGLRANRVLKDWAGIVGPALALRSHPDKFENGTVWIAVEGSAWAQELRMQKETILRRLRTRSDGAELFVDVRFGVRPLPPAAQLAPSAVIELRDDIVPDSSIREIAERRLQNWPDADGA